MPSARVSKSSGDSPLAKLLESSASRASALKTSPQRPQRTWPPAARSTSADNRKTVSHLEHCVYTLDGSPGVDAAPVIALNDLHHIKSRRVGGFYRVGLRLQQARQKQIASRFAGCRQFRRQFDQRAGKNVGQHAIRRRQGAFDPAHVDIWGDAVADRVL